MESSDESSNGDSDHDEDNQKTYKYNPNYADCDTSLTSDPQTTVPEVDALYIPPTSPESELEDSGSESDADLYVPNSKKKKSTNVRKGRIVFEDSDDDNTSSSSSSVGEVVKDEGGDDER